MKSIPPQHRGRCNVCGYRIASVNTLIRATADELRLCERCREVYDITGRLEISEREHAAARRHRRRTAKTTAYIGRLKTAYLTRVERGEVASHEQCARDAGASGEQASRTQLRRWVPEMNWETLKAAWDRHRAGGR